MPKNKIYPGCIFVCYCILQSIYMLLHTCVLCPSCKRPEAGDAECGTKQLVSRALYSECLLKLVLAAAAAAAWEADLTMQLCWPGAHYIHQAGLELVTIFLPLQKL